ncbi:Squalene synthase [Tupaia chinensis]|uniref:Squalene synthase n=1 Tax=Tupaia chinensis TaxID=246437 RepID=L8YD89_TUPCH|nr:Squalene synthase [Tupaia chinensis]
MAAAAACGPKAMSLFKRTLVLSPAAAPRGPGAGTSPRGCPLSPTAWPQKDWPLGEGVCGRLWSPTAARLPDSRSCSCSCAYSSTSSTVACLLCPQDSLSSSLKTCYQYLNQTSRSFAAVIQALDTEIRNLAEKYQIVIADICRKMGMGMAEFLNKHVTSEREWDKVWSRYVKKLEDFAKPENIDLAVQCLNELVTNALHHIPDVLTYLSRLRNQSVFNFCAIPQVMAIATLAACYNNQQVFKGVVKIRKGQAVTLMMDATNMPAVKAIIYQYIEEIYHRIPNSDPSSSKTRQIISTIRAQNLPTCQLISRSHYSPIYLSFVMLLAALSWQYLSTLSQVTEDFVQTGEH